MLSLVAGSSACMAKCPFCVSGEKPDSNNMKEPYVNWRKLKVAANLANRTGVNNVVLTSRGEATLFPSQITKYLETISEFNFPFIELQTNGIPLAQNPEKYLPYLRKWYELGLTTVAISLVSNIPEINRQNYLPHSEKFIDIKKLIEQLHDVGFSIRLACICCSGWVDGPEEVRDFVMWAKEIGAEQTTIRPVNWEYRRESAHKWIEQHILTKQQKESIRNLLEHEGTLLMKLDRLGSIYDFYGQNVFLSMPLDKDTRDTNPEHLRQIIFFQDGHIRYEWELDGGILL